MGSPETSTTDHWSSIPPDIFLLIAGKIISGEDYIMLSATCRTWYTLANDLYTNLNHKLHLRPLHVAGTDPNSNRITLQNLSSGTTFPVNLPETAGAGRCWGSPFGWLISLDHTDLHVTLFNPFTGATVLLPSLPLDESESSRYNNVESKAFLTASPDDEDCLVVVSISGKVAVAGPTAKTWSWLLYPSRDGFDLHNIVYHKGNLYGIESSPSHIVKLFVFPLTLTLTGRYVRFQTLNLAPCQNIFCRNYDPSDIGVYRPLYVVHGELCLCGRFGVGLLFFLARQLVVVNGEHCLRVRYYTRGAFCLASSYSLFKISFLDRNVTRLDLLGDRWLRFDRGHSFSCMTGSRYEFSDNQEYVYACLNDYVVYTNYNNGPLDVDVWDLLRSLKGDVYSYQSSSARPFWILPSIKFRKLEGVAINLDS